MFSDFFVLFLRMWTEKRWGMRARLCLSPLLKLKFFFVVAPAVLWRLVFMHVVASDG